MNDGDRHKRWRDRFSQPKIRRGLRIAAAALGVAIVSWIASFAIRGLDARIDYELLKGFSELSNANSYQISRAGNVIADHCCLALGLYLFCIAGLWTGYRLKRNERVISFLQLLALSIIYEKLCWDVLSASGHPLTFGIALASSSVCGYLIKSRENRHRLEETQHYELILRNQELQESRLAMVKQDETERRLLAADLHDQVLSDLRIIVKKIDRFQDGQDKTLDAGVRTQLNQVMTQIREIMDNLCPIALQHFGLAAAIEQCLDKGAQIAGFQVRFRLSADASELQALSMVQQQLIYRLVQESINNICKHAGASRVQAIIEKEGSDLLIKIIDNGGGIDYSKVSEASRGLIYMRLRASLIGAALSWSPGPDGKGTQVEIRLPSRGAAVSDAKQI